jgi:hypothetical protein
VRFLSFVSGVLTRFHSRYPGSTHASQSYKIFAVAPALTLVDTLGACRRLITSIAGAEHYTVKGLHALLGWEHSELRVVPEYIALIGEAHESIKDPKETPES